MSLTILTEVYYFYVGTFLDVIISLPFERGIQNTFTRDSNFIIPEQMESEKKPTRINLITYTYSYYNIFKIGSIQHIKLKIKLKPTQNKTINKRKKSFIKITFRQVWKMLK